MEELSILIVDDEKYEGVLIEKCVDWQQHGFRIAGSVQSAREALELFILESPDIVFCDINMPLMNGLELSRQMKALQPEVHIVIITGYREFEYARQAVQLGAEDYILKPVQAEELLKAADKIRAGYADAEKAREMPDGYGQIRNDIVKKAVRYIEKNLSVGGLSLKTIAPALYVNCSYLSRVFKDETGENLTAYILRRRMEKSAELLSSTDLRAYEVAALVGMPDAHYFGQCFRRFTGKTVNEYRKK